jgi:hypothetical protein
MRRGRSFIVFVNSISVYVKFILGIDTPVRMGKGVRVRVRVRM